MIFSKFKKIAKGKLICLVYVEGVNQRGHRIIGFLDLKDRSDDVSSRLDLHPFWLVPTRDDLTFFNLATNNSQTTSTKVGFC